MFNVMKFRPGLGTWAAVVAAGVQVYLHIMEVRAMKARAERAPLGDIGLVELQRLREVYRAGAWGLLRLNSEEWTAVGVEDPALASGLAQLGLGPHPDCGSSLTEEEAASVTAAFGRPVSAKTLAGLLDEDEVDGAAAFAFVVARRLGTLEP